MQNVSGTAVSHEKLKQYLAQESDDLLKTLRLYVWRAGLAEGTAVNNLARELLSEVVVEALNHASRFDSQRQPKAWLLGIAANLVRRKQKTINKQARREPLIQDLSQQATLSEDELFEKLTAAHIPGPDKQYEMEETMTAVLRQLSVDDQQIITLAMMLEMDGDTLAKTLGIRPGAARMRLHRALNRLRESWVIVNRGNA